jgi:hypothetical protein
MEAGGIVVIDNETPLHQRDVGDPNAQPWLYIDLNSNEIVDEDENVIVTLSKDLRQFESWHELLNEVEEQTGQRYEVEETDGRTVLKPT